MKITAIFLPCVFLDQLTTTMFSVFVQLTTIRRFVLICGFLKFVFVSHGFSQNIHTSVHRNHVLDIKMASMVNSDSTDGEPCAKRAALECATCKMPDPKTTFECSTCSNAVLCHNCVNTHLLCDHQVVDYLQRPADFCKVHFHLIDTFCKTCSKALCALCGRQHWQHDVLDIAEECSLIPSSLSSQCRKLENKNIEEVTTQIQQFKDALITKKQLFSRNQQEFRVKRQEIIELMDLLYLNREKEENAFQSEVLLHIGNFSQLVKGWESHVVSIQAFLSDLSSLAPSDQAVGHSNLVEKTRVMLTQFEAAIGCDQPLLHRSSVVPQGLILL